MKDSHPDKDPTEEPDRTAPRMGVSLCARPCSDWMFAQHNGLLWMRAHMMRKWVKARHNVHYPAEDLVGLAWMNLDDALRWFDMSRGVQFSTYYCSRAETRDLARFIRDDAMWMSLRIRTSSQKKSCEYNADTHEQDYMLYRVPELDESWTAAILELFDNDKDRLWRLLLDACKEDDRDFVRLYYAEQRTVTEIAERKRVSKQRVHQRLKRAKEKMRAKLMKLTEVAEVFGTWDGLRKLGRGELKNYKSKQPDEEARDAGE